MQNQGLSPERPGLSRGACGRPRGTRVQMPGEVGGPSEGHEPSLGSCSWIGEWGDASGEEGAAWAVDPGDALFLVGWGVELQIPGALAQPARTACLTPRGWCRSG